MNIKSKLRNYISNNFPSLSLSKPLFYSWETGIRFELGIGEYCEKYFDELINKAIILFESSFSRNDNVFIVYQRFCYDRQKIKKTDYLFKQIDHLDFTEVGFEKVLNLYGNDDLWKRAIIETKVENINYKNLLAASANYDFIDRKPQLKGELYFVNTTKNIIFHMYDDRGLDVISSSKADLQDLYTKYNDWILEYDREIIDEVFSN